MRTVPVAIRLDAMQCDISCALSLTAHCLRQVLGYGALIYFYWDSAFLTFNLPARALPLVRIVNAFPAIVPWVLINHRVIAMIFST